MVVTAGRAVVLVDVWHRVWEVPVLQVRETAEVVRRLISRTGMVEVARAEQAVRRARQWSEQQGLACLFRLLVQPRPTRLAVQVATERRTPQPGHLVVSTAGPVVPVATVSRREPSVDTAVTVEAAS